MLNDPTGLEPVPLNLRKIIDTGTAGGVSDPGFGSAFWSAFGNLVNNMWDGAGPNGASTWSSSSPGQYSILSGSPDVVLARVGVERSRSGEYGYWVNSNTSSATGVTIGSYFRVFDRGQTKGEGPNIYAEIKNSFDEVKYDYMNGDGGGLAATFYSKGNYSVFKNGDKYYFSASAGMRTLANHRGDITPQGSASLTVNGKEVKVLSFATPAGTSLSSKSYTDIGNVLIELPTTGTVLINLNFSYGIDFSGQGHTHSATLTVPVQIRTLGIPRD